MPFDAVDDLVTAAARNNAHWCDTVCRSHVIAGSFGAGLWSSATRTPRWYPDAVTLDRSARTVDILDRIDVAPGCSIKDSFATLDLAPHGFDVLFDATWIARSLGTPKESTDATVWKIVTDAAAFEAWEQSWRGGDIDAAGILLPSLLADPSIDVLVGHRDGMLVAGGIANRSDDVIGISNVFCGTDDIDDTWASLGTWIARLDPGRRVVGYESGAELEAAIGAGFTTLGPLRVWLHQS